jgi:SAM-dependent methyltransferase
MFGSLSKVLLLIVEPEAQGAYHKFDTRNSSFYDQEDLEGSLNYQVYLKHRFSAESFWSLYPFLRLLRENAEWVLDLGCGVGHASFVISTCVRPNRLLCADSNLKNLIMLKRFFVSKAECIRIDANYPLPFRDKIFSSVLMLDSFHYVRSQALLAGELERILGAQGILLILHLHNSLGKNVSAGYSLPPKTMADLFRGTAVKIFPEDDLLEQFLKEGLLDLSKTYSEADLNLSNVVALVASNSKDAFRRYLDVADEFMQCRSNLVINPIYEVKVVKNRLIMERHFPSEFFRREYPMTERYLPESCVVERELADDVKERRKLGPQWASPDHFSRTRELMMKFVIINVPEKYI